jgi:hypothetical protein
VYVELTFLSNWPNFFDVLAGKQFLAQATLSWEESGWCGEMDFTDKCRENLPL